MLRVRVLKCNKIVYFTGFYDTGPFKLKIEDNGNMYATNGKNVPYWNRYAQLGRLYSGSVMVIGQKISSPNGKFTFVMQADGNLVCNNMIVTQW